MTNNIAPQRMHVLAAALDAGVFRNESLWPDEAQDVEDSIVALRTAANQLEAVQDRDRIDSAIGEVLCNVSNYPPEVSFRLLGLDIGPLRRKVTDAVLAILTADTAPQEDDHV